MPRKKLDNKLTGIKPEFGSILVCNKKNLRPFVEIIIEEPENVSHQGLGTLIGVFEITDTSEDSSYVVNYLVSIIKKEYFSKAKRGPIESLESALHKANLALANLAEHKNINWLGKLNALVAVTEKNNLHLSQTGTASAFLLRSQTLTDVSEGLAPSDSDPYPLKTFVSVSSGRLQSDDKLVITTAGMFDIFSLEEIKKSALRFSNEEFIQFLKTALGNELEIAAVLVADLKIQKKILMEKPVVSQKELNAFSRDAFSESPRKNKPQEMKETIQKEIRENPQSFVDEKTGHIYIKEDYDSSSNFQEDNTNYFEIILEKTSRHLKSSLTLLKSLPKPDIKKIHLPKININTEKIRSHSSQAFKSTASGLKNISTQLKNSAAKNAPQDPSRKTKELLQKIGLSIANLSKKILPKIFFIGKIIAPSLAKIKRHFDRMEYQQKIYALLILVLIFIVPIFIVKMQNANQLKQAAIVETENKPAALPLEGDVNVTRIESLGDFFSAANVQKILPLGEQIFAVTPTGIIDIQNSQTYPIPENFHSPTQTIKMDDLNLIFLLNQKNEIMSFSPISKKFETNNITVPNGSAIVATGSYLTYIYLADQKNNQIYRYPRAEGGFGEKSDWLKDAFDFSNVTDMAIDENVYISTDSTITKLFRGKIQELSMEKTATPINISRLALGEVTKNIFILDKDNSRIIQFDSENKIKAQYYHPQISAATDFMINEKTNQIHLATDQNIKTLPLNN